MDHASGPDPRIGYHSMTRAAEHPRRGVEEPFTVGMRCMVRFHPRYRALVGLGFLALCVAATSCSGGDSGGGGAPAGIGSLLATSFSAFVDPTGAIQLSPVFVDQTLTFQFDGPFDPGIFGGFLADAGGAPVEFLGVGPTLVGAVPYYAFNDQAAARTSLQIRENVQGAPLLASYVVGRHRDDPDTLVVDPKVPAQNPFGLPANGGYLIQTEHTYRVPAVNGIVLASGAMAQPVGVDPAQLPIVLMLPLPVPSPVFAVGASGGPDPIPPEVVAIEALDGNGQPVAGTPGDPLPAQDGTIRVTFSKPIDWTSVDPLANLVIRNLDVTTSGNPNGIVVPGNFFSGPPLSPQLTFAPTPTWGPGVSPTVGYSIQVTVGTSGDPSLPPILGLPSGNPPTQHTLANTLVATFVTEPCVTCQLGIPISESFDTNLQEDVAFLPAMGRALWNDASSPGTLSSGAISGSPLASFSGAPQNLGTRTQVNMPIGTGTTLPLTTVPFAGLPEPFANLSTPGGGGTGLGSHSQWLVESVDLGSPRASLELIEWGPVGNTVVPTTYPQYQCWAGMTSIAGPITCPSGISGISTIYSINYDIAPLQPPDPMNLNPNQVSNPGAGGVLVSPAQGYAVMPATTAYYPFPVFTPPFDYIGSGAGAGNLLYEINIEDGMQLANLNRYRATAFVPVRRIVGLPISSGSITANGAGCDTYDTRFTFVNVLTSTQSLFYDSGVVTGTPTYQFISIVPSPSNQPGLTFAQWEFEGATAIAGPGAPVGPTSGFLTYWTGTPVAGFFDPAVLSVPSNPSAPQLTGNRYFRFRTTLRNDSVQNESQTYDSLVVVLTVGP